MSLGEHIISAQVLSFFDPASAAKVIAKIMDGKPLHPSVTSTCFFFGVEKDHHTCHMLLFLRGVSFSCWLERRPLKDISINL